MAASPPAAAVPSSGSGSTPMKSVIGPQRRSTMPSISWRSSSYAAVQVAQTLIFPGKAALEREAQPSTQSGSTSWAAGSASSGMALRNTMLAQTTASTHHRSLLLIAVSSCDASDPLGKSAARWIELLNSRSARVRPNFNHQGGGRYGNADLGWHRAN